ncbi:MAG: hypothetical protein A2268_03180 [Candidatus Raymondbacteria bacterium RifOxyA12_full_50_37]|uniref:Outer membrane lipoprotein BamD-like domain-containing protein n=1 Tax=Candidatus Raymondbacteria bacterium RIFOXYD12_FULL_49_13 TaxID=1817890 RepID=A0A1F7F843_UNCRA|nr:MAG: hypothetical protein A2268_03180 [Candidatus Raymondbacteria bacterium RifOxyA12_full_50_37]OGJ86743.1 MAG: hypothetical protein A2248_09910 [Candidatus Raymondbacteria bacterium RIFOXYA2_FULL_49_16]OGJ97804.1 MAG: hypothetical protein A2487_11270 [Candidatus Raymondbacteria bacterium RifOxyC12_full_50_8]OGK01549.1 MAG: hypothetical protein A2350_06445 [Candidatus Raymondbacteria bacterium RifOxyB12_full_50_8]OGK02835.1 MAG: hypothetical protein A2519_06620 [Candidatus Raymondbacteria b
MRWFSSRSLAHVLFAISAVCGQQQVIDPYELLQQLHSFPAMFEQKDLTAYQADAKITGSICQSLEQMAREKNLSEPRFAEFYTREKGFVFLLANRDYPLFFNQMLDELFTPVRAFDKVIESIESKREFNWFQTFKMNTTVEYKWVQYKDAPHLKLDFTAKEGRVIEKKIETLNGVTHTIETKAMRLIVSPKEKLIKSLTIVLLEQTGAKPIETDNRFTFFYETVNGKPLPAELIIEKNNRELIRFHGEYAKQGTFIVFRKKTFTFTKTDGTTGSATIDFSNYRFNDKIDRSLLQDKSLVPIDPVAEQEAEKLFNQAKELILEGKTDEAREILKKLIKKYPKASYAEQAKILLEGFPQ